MKQPTNLGYFQREPQVFSGIILMPVEIYGESIQLLGAFSVLHVKNRIIYAHLYRRLTDEKDAEILRDTARSWTAAIIAANR